MNKIIYIDDNGFLNLSRLRPDQQLFVKSNYLHSGIVGGYQSGKSLSAKVKAISELLQNPGVPIAYYLPTYGLIEDMLAPTLISLFKSINTEVHHNKKESKLITPYGEVWMRSMDTPDRIVSYSVGYSLIDEVDVVHPNKRDDAMKRISSRNSYKKSTKNKIDFVSTPEGFGYMYNFFVKRANQNKILYQLDTLDNANNLGDGYIDGLRELYTEEQLRAYLHGEFVNLTSGTVAYRFDRKLNHSDATVQPDDILHIGMDFNITHMSAVVHVVRDGNPIAVDEFTDLYDTATMIEAIKERYGNHKIAIYPDAAGKARSTSGLSDIRLLKDAGFIINVLSKNPAVTDRITTVNIMLLDNKGNRKYKVNTDICINYTESLEQLAYKNGSPDKSSGLDHIFDAATYFIYYRNGLKRKRKGQR